MSVRRFAVGDRVRFDVTGDGRPVWNYKYRRGHKLNTVVGEVTNVYRDNFSVKFPRGTLYDCWDFPFVMPVDNPDGWPELDDPVVPAPAPTPPPPAAWQERIAVNRRQDVPDPVMTAAIDRGERGVRRKLRAWPDNSRLTHTIERLKGDTQDEVVITWRWERLPD